MAAKRQPLLSLSAWQLIQAMQDGVIITDSKVAIRAVNDAFCAVTGYVRPDVIGRNPRLLHSGRHDRTFYSRMWSSIRADGSWQGEIWNRRKNGAVYPEWLTISAIKDPWGQTRCYLGVFRDITSPKLNEERLKQLAQFDPLTGLPNRRLFNERLHRALAGRRPLAVLFLDLDRFKDDWATPRAMYAVKEHGGDGVRFWTRAVSLQSTSAQGNDSGESPRPGKTVPLRERAPQKPHSRTRKRRRPRQFGVHETAIRS